MKKEHVITYRGYTIDHITTEGRTHDDTFDNAMKEVFGKLRIIPIKGRCTCELCQMADDMEKRHAHKGS